MSQNILLIGFMGCGKSRLAKAFKKMFKYSTLDTDRIISDKTGKAISDIFAEHGEPYFRELERKTAVKLQKKFTKADGPFILATGGGFFQVPNLKEIARVVYMHGSFEDHIRRLKSKGDPKKQFAKRPLLKDLEKGKALWNEREPRYRELADLTVSITGPEGEIRTSEDIARELGEKLGIR